MAVSLQITVRNVSLSEAAEENIRERASKLDSFYDRITSCRVTVDAPHRRQHKGILYDVRIDMTVPGSELVIKREPHEDVYVAIRNAFDAARRQLEDFARRQRGEVKSHVAPPHARISKLFPEEGYGFLETPGGREVYFHRNSVLNGGFDRLKIGMEVRFAEEEGEKGPQASTVTPIGKRD
jgi:ribosomal subunit interface protein